MYAALAQKERALISRRTKEALAALKAGGKKLGMHAPSKCNQVRRLSALGVAGNRNAAIARLKPLEWSIKASLTEGVTLRAAADLLNERGIPSPAGGRWYGPSLHKAARRLGLR
jgi:DNA invertase Pin-like site-specific DNA recombinase